MSRSWDKAPWRPSLGRRLYDDAVIRSGSRDKWREAYTEREPGHHLRGVLHERGTRSTVDDQPGYSDRCQSFRGDRAIPYDGIIDG